MELVIYKFDTLHPSPYIRHPTSFIAHPTPCNKHPKPYILNLKPETPPLTSKPQIQTPFPKP